MHETLYTTATDAPLDAVIAGTLCLMSCYVAHPAPVYADRVAANLAGLAQFATLTPELRSICQRLATRWEAIRADAQARSHAGEKPPDGRHLH